MMSQEKNAIPSFLGKIRRIQKDVQFRAAGGKGLGQFLQPGRCAVTEQKGEITLLSFEKKRKMVTGWRK